MRIDYWQLSQFGQIDVHILWPLVLFTLILGGEYIMSRRYYGKCINCNKQVVVFTKAEADDTLSLYCERCKKQAIENLLNGSFSQPLGKNHDQNKED